MSDLKNNIRKALAGSNSLSPVDTKSLLKLGSSGEIAGALEQLLASREINTAKVFKGGAWSVQCWLTGAIGLAPALTIRPPQIAPPVRPPEVQPTASIPTQQPQEKPMSTKISLIRGKASPITVAILELAGEQPGTGREMLIERALKRAPGATEEHAIKTLQNLLYASKKLRAEGTRGNFTFYLNDGKAAKPAPEKADKPARVKLAKVEVTSGTDVDKPAPASKLPNCAKSQVQDEQYFSVMLEESGYLSICCNNSEVTLNTANITRLHRFIGRINLTEIVPV